MEKRVGKYSLIVGVIVAVVLGLAAKTTGSAEPWLWSLLVVLGIVVGFLNITGKETKEFLWVTVALVIVSYAGSTQVNSWETQVKIVGPYLKTIFDAILALVVPATIVVALKDAYELAKVD